MHGEQIRRRSSGKGKEREIVVEDPVIDERNVVDMVQMLVSFEKGRTK